VASASSDAHTGDRQTLTEINRLARTIAAEAGRPAPADAVVAIQTSAGRLANIANELDRSAPSDARTDFAYWCRAVLDAAGNLTAAPSVSAAALRRLAGRLSALADAMQFDFLYNRRRRIFSIGYRLADADGGGR
jgi:hypothetical protein